MIDTHAHVHLPEFAADRDRVLTRSFAAGLSGIIEVGISAGAWPEVLALAAADPRIYACLGLHPHEASRCDPQSMRTLAGLLGRAKVVAVGETGIDAERGYAAREDQVRLFAAHIALARDTGLPLVIHCRGAFPDVLETIDREGRAAVRGVFHCFTGSSADAAAVTARGFLIGLGGAVTYDPPHWTPLVAGLPADAILLETDAPFLRPAPDRRGRNEPGLIYLTGGQVAAMRGCTPGALEETADRNACRLFDLGLPCAGTIPICAPNPKEQ